MGVEPTILAAKDRINGFEGHEDHRTLFASDEETVTAIDIAATVTCADRL